MDDLKKYSFSFGGGLPSMVGLLNISFNIYLSYTAGVFAVIVNSHNKKKLLNLYLMQVEFVLHNLST